MDEPKVVFDHVWKKFRRGERHDSLRDLVPATAARLFGRQPSRSDLGKQEFWAVKDVSFSVRPGRALGIIGPNGAGKSTTLKLLTRILRPTTGQLQVTGRVGALIEIAAGFHPDLTGRENIFLQGAIMGMQHAEIRRKVDEIIAFAGVEAFVDSPVKRYSSGMNARLGFSIAAHLDPDVLIVDEVLSVGDAAFQERCVRRMHEFKRQGVAIVFVSHNLQAVSALCDEALFIKNEMRASGPTSGVIRSYLESLESTTQPETGGPIDILSAKLTDVAGATATTVAPGAALQLVVGYRVRRALTDVDLSFVCHRSTDMTVAYDGNFVDRETRLSTVPPGSVIEVIFTFAAHLTRGQYHITCEVHDNPTQQILARLSPAAMITIAEDRTWEGIADLAVQATPATILG